MKIGVVFFAIFLSLNGFTQEHCDVRLGDSQGIKVMEFASGNMIHSKMALRDVSPQALFEEIISLQEMGVCSEKIYARKCVLRYEKKNTINHLTFFRGQERWMTWKVSLKKDAQDFIRSLIRIGFCA